MILVQRFFFTCLIFTSINLFSQKEKVKQDSIKGEKLDEVIVIGRNNVMTLSKKLFTVGTLKKHEIEKVAANNLADVLTQNLNITITPDVSTGKSTASLFGLDGQYVKILLDGIPMAGDNGLGNNIDITQINLEDVERIEIVEGAMGVLYGDNAVAGVINIVTSNKVKHEWEIQASLQEETVGNEYNLKDRGRHIQNIKISNNTIEKLRFTFGASKNDYQGFYNIYEGKDYVNITDNIVVNDGLRGTEWNPKEQITLYANANLVLGKHNFFYKFQYFDESITIYDRFITGRLEIVGISATTTDEVFDTDRFVNNLTISGPFNGQTKYNLFFSQQTQKRYYQEYVYNILLKGTESIINDGLSQSSNIYYSKGFLSNIIPESDFTNLQLGYEFTWQKGFDAIASGDYSDNVVENTLNNYDFFGIADFKLTKKLSIHPGSRLINNSQFGTKLIGSVSSNYNISDSFKLKTILGSAFRAPNFEELFFFFVDANHNVQGNPNLQPEDGVSVFLNLNKDLNLKNNNYLKTTFKSYFFDIKNKIATIITEDEDGRNLTTPDNIDNSKIIGFSLENTFTKENLSLGLGATYMGESTTINASDISNTDYLWSFNLQSNINYKIPRIKTSLSGQLKYTGKTQVLLEDNDVDGGLALGITDSFTWVDASIKTEITKNINLTFGTRNLLNIITVNASDVAAGGHDTNAANSRLFGNGRSYFLKLLFNLNTN